MIQKPKHSLDFKVKTISFNSRNNCFSFHSKSSVQTNVILLKKNPFKSWPCTKKKKTTTSIYEEKEDKKKKQKSKNPLCHLCIFRKPKYFFASLL